MRLLILFLFMTSSCLAQISGSMNTTAPDLPRYWIASTLNSANYPDLFTSPVVKTVKASGGDYTSLQAAWTAISTDAPSCGEIIIVDSGYTSDSPGNGANGGKGVEYSMTCPANKHVWVQPSNLSLLPPQGTRVQISDKANMFTIAKSTIGSTSDTAVTVDDGASGLIITGMDLEVSGPAVFSGWQIGSSANGSNYTNHIGIERSYLDTTYATMMHHVLFVDAQWFFFTDSVIDHINILHSDACTTYSESHDFIAYNSEGPGKLVNNYFGGAPTENVFFGGSRSQQKWINVSDYEIRRNTLFKDPAQIPNAAVKNVFEMKDGKRFLVDGNTMQYSVADWQACGGNQHGSAMDFTVAANDAAADYYTEVSNVTFTNNEIQHMDSFGQILGHAVIFLQFPVTKKISISNNLFRDTNRWVYAVSPVVPVTAASLTSNVVTLTVTSSTGFTTGNPLVVSGFSGADAFFNVNGLNVSGHTSTTITYGLAHADATATTTGQVGSETYTVSGFSMTNGGVVSAQGANTRDSGPYEFTMDHNGFYGSSYPASNSLNGAMAVYISSPPKIGNSRGSIPQWTYTNNVLVTDTSTMNADSSPTMSTMLAAGTFPGFVTGGNILFNFTNTGTNTCSNWSPVNPGICPAGLASSPSTINSTLGIADYQTCSQGDTTPGSSTLASCVITGANAGAGPDISKIIAAQAEPNDSTKWGARTPN
jgi:hypothetical protein